MISSIEQLKTISDHILPSRIVRIPLPLRVAQIDNIISIRRNPLPIPYPRHTSEWRCYDNYETIGQIESPPSIPILLQQHFQVVRVNNNTLIAKLHRNCTKRVTLTRCPGIIRSIRAPNLWIIVESRPKPSRSCGNFSDRLIGPWDRDMGARSGRESRESGRPPSKTRHTRLHHAYGDNGTRLIRLMNTCRRFGLSRAYHAWNMIAPDVHKQTNERTNKQTEEGGNFAIITRD